MPRGIYDRKAARLRRESNPILNVQIPAEPVVPETEEEIMARITERFEVMELMVQGCLNGDVTSLILEGPAGMGKSHTVEKALQEFDPDGETCKIHRGRITTVALYQLLYRHRKQGSVLVFDDCDDVYGDENSLNILKAALDSSQTRTISYLTGGNIVDEDSGEFLPKTFQFEGTIIFLTNMDLDAMSRGSGRLAPHMAALISRSHYITLNMRSRRDYMVRIKQVAANMLTEQGLDWAKQAELLAYMEDNQDRLRELSLRMLKKLGNLMKVHGDRWTRVAKITAFIPGR